jgi:hypothetical protein
MHGLSYELRGAANVGINQRLNAKVVVRVGTLLSVSVAKENSVITTAGGRTGIARACK